MEATPKQYSACACLGCSASARSYSCTPAPTQALNLPLLLYGCWEVLGRQGSPGVRSAGALCYAKRVLRAVTRALSWKHTRLPSGLQEATLKLLTRLAAAAPPVVSH